ncbi:MAG: YeeE/YedE family protein [Gammaproteobacteria bacterium]|nr:YeeE/YedE family protein [Gammaproteobacteria bacterium]
METETKAKSIPTSHLLIIISSGILFGLGLSLSEMVNPSRVLGFLNVLGTWDPTLLFVMAGALSVTIPGFQYAKLIKKPFLAINFSMPAKSDLDRDLIVGAVIFGIGWGLAGICPGPALVALNVFEINIVVFILAMFGGMFVYNRLQKF